MEFLGGEEATAVAEYVTALEQANAEQRAELVQLRARVQGGINDRT